MALQVKNPPTMQKTQVLFLGWEDSLERKWQPTPVFLPAKPHRQRSLAGYSSKHHKESDMTEPLSMHIPPYGIHSQQERGTNYWYMHTTEPQMQHGISCNMLRSDKELHNILCHYTTFGTSYGYTTDLCRGESSMKKDTGRSGRY